MAERKKGHGNRKEISLSSNSSLNDDDQCSSKDGESWKSYCISVSTPCCDSTEKVTVKVPEPRQIYVIAYQRGNLSLTGTWFLPFNGTATSSFPDNFCRGTFKIPKCGDGLYQINISVEGSSDLAGTIASLLITNETGLFTNVVTEMNFNITSSKQTISITYPLKAHYSVAVTGTGNLNILGGAKTFFNLVRVA